MENEIGKEGASLNFTTASRAINRLPDEEQMKQYDEYKASINPMGVIALVIGLGLAVWDIYLFMGGHWIWGILLAIVTVFVFLLSKSLLAATLLKSIAYENGLIVSAIVVNTSPLQILALADMRANNNLPVVYGCQKMTVKALPGHTLEKYEKVPCASLFGVATKGYRHFFEPRPVCWGYTDPEVVAQTILAIDNDEEALPCESEWDMLQKLESEMKDAPEKEVFFFDENLNKIEL